MSKKQARGPRDGIKHQARGHERKNAPRRKRRFQRRADKPGVERFFPKGAKGKAFFAREEYQDGWVELTYIYDQVIYWLYGREDRRRACEFRDRFE
jgi:hypothetical protein